MQRTNRRWKRVLIGIAITLAVFFLILLAVISPLAKYAIEKYDDVILGRKIELRWIYVNPLTGYVHIDHLKVYECESEDSIFFKADGVSADFSMLKLFKKTYEINSITVDKPWGIIVQQHGILNFQDIIAHFRRKDRDAPKDTEPTHFNILNCKINDGEFHYCQPLIPVVYYVKHVNIQSPGKWWDVDSMLFKVALQSGPTSGDVNGTFSMNFKTLDYRIKGKIDSFDLKPLSQYMRQLSNYGDFGGVVYANGEGEGNFMDKLALKTRGLISINQFQFGPSIYEDYGSFQRLVLDIKEADPGGRKYLIDSIMLDRPYFRYERYDYLDNLTRMFGKKGTKPGIHSDQAQFNLILKIAEYLNELLKNFEKSYYKIDKFTLYKGNLVFNDYSLREKFGVDAMPIYIRADSIDKHLERMNIELKAGVRPFGNIDMGISLDPNDYGYFDVNYKIYKVPVSVFNPYLITYTSFPLDRGTLEVNGDWIVEDSMIRSTNHVLVMDPRVGKKIKRSDTKWLPLPLIMSIVRGPGEVIDYEIPVHGNLKSPVFNIHNVIMDVVKNIFIKPPSTPYLFKVKDAENTVEKYLFLNWQMRQTTLNNQQQKFVNKMSKFLKKNPGFSITVAPMVYEDKEKEHIILFEAKKKYFVSSKPKGYDITDQDSLYLEQLSIKDTLFVRYVDRWVGDTMMFTAQQKCNYMLGENFITAKFKQLNATREGVFLAAFKNDGTDKQIKFSKPEMGIPFNGFSRYKIDYNGNVPDELRDAYEDMSAFNASGPRKKYNGDRWMPPVKGIKK